MLRRYGRGWRVLSGLVCLVALLAACAPAASPAAPGGQSDQKSGPVKLRFALNNPILNPGLAFVWLGKGLGYFDEEGIDLDITPTQGAAESTQLVAAGKVDIAIPPPSALLSAAADGTDLGLVSVYLQNRLTIQELVVNPDSPIQTLKDLKGKKIGVMSQGDESATFAEATAVDQGFAKTDVQLVAVGAGIQAATQLKQGAVDALAIADVQRTLAEGQGFTFRHLEQPSFTAHIFGNEIVVRKDWLNQPQNKDALTRYLRILAKDTLFMVTNPRAAIQLHYKLYPETLPKGQSIDDAIKANLPSLEVRNPKLSLDTAKVKKWGINDHDDWLAYIKYVGLADKIKDPEPFYTNELIDQVNTFDQQAVINQAKSYQP